jgi:hypothetical protein
MNEWDELFDYIEEHKDDPIPESQVVSEDDAYDAYWAELDPQAYMIRLMQTAWDLRLSSMVRKRAKERIYHHLYGNYVNEADRNQIIDRIGEPLSALFEPDPE